METSICQSVGRERAGQRVCRQCVSASGRAGGEGKSRKHAVVKAAQLCQHTELHTLQQCDG